MDVQFQGGAISAGSRKKRLDERVVECGFALDIETARRLIMAGEIRTGDRVWDKAGEKVAVDQLLERKGKPFPWVSRGALKLVRGLEAFGLEVDGKRCLDIGSSTGGFTEVLLRRGASSVVSLDVGYGLLDACIRKDSRVEVRERTNFRTLSDDAFPEPFDLVVTDVSFISLRLIIPKAFRMLRPGGGMIALIKPQFEAARECVESGGLVRDPDVHLKVVSELRADLAPAGVFLRALEPAPILDKAKNVEFLSLWRRESGSLAADSLAADSLSADSIAADLVAERIKRAFLTWLSLEKQ